MLLIIHLKNLTIFRPGGKISNYSRMKKRSEISQILADWDPLGIGNTQIATDEYQAYIPRVIKHRNNRPNWKMF